MGGFQVIMHNLGTVFSLVLNSVIWLLVRKHVYLCNTLWKVYLGGDTMLTHKKNPLNPSNKILTNDNKNGS